MKAADIKKQSRSSLTSGTVVSVSPDTRLEDALALMTKHQIHHLPVVQGGALVGLLVDRDVLSAFIASPSGDPALTLWFQSQTRQISNQLQTTEVREEVRVKNADDDLAQSLIVERYMQRNVPTIDESTDLREALNRMLQSHVSALPILRDGVLAGIITESDLLRLLDTLLKRGEPLENVVERGEALLSNPLLQNVFKALSDSGI